MPWLTVDVARVTPRVEATLSRVAWTSLGVLNEYAGADPAAVEKLSPPVKL